MTGDADSGASARSKETTVVTQVTIETVDTLSEDEGHNKVKENIFY